jgi:glycosyltransferase involved in cell wall biosynthesis
MSASRPTVSVVVPCYRYGEYLNECVDSILRQEGVEVRVLIIDDASPDDSFSKAQALANRDARVAVRRHETNHGHIATYNEGLLEWAEGKYSVLISADDMLVDGALARAVAVMEAHPGVGLVYGHAIDWVDNRPLPAPRTVSTATRIWKGHEWVSTVCRLGHNVVTSPEVVVRTKLQREVGGYRAELPHSGDLEMWLRFAARSDVAYVEGADQAYYRIHAANMTVARSPTVDLKQRMAAFSSFFAECGDLMPDAEELFWAARREIAKEALWRARRAYERRRLSETPVTELKQLAYETYPLSHGLVEHWGLRWCEQVGPELAPYLQLFTIAAVYRRVRKMMWRRRWRLKGC